MAWRLREVTLQYKAGARSMHLVGPWDSALARAKSWVHYLVALTIIITGGSTTSSPLRPLDFSMATTSPLLAAKIFGRTNTTGPAMVSLEAWTTVSSRARLSI